MKIAVVNAARNYGGQEAMAAALCEAFQQRGHDVLFLCRPVSPVLDRLRNRVTCAPVLTGMDADPRALVGSYQVLRRFRPDVLLATTNKDMRSAALIARGLGVPVVVRRAMDRPFPKSRTYRLLYGWLPEHIVTNSEATLRVMLESAPWIDPGRTSVIYNGIDTRRFAGAAPADLGLPADAVSIGYVGRFVWLKGIRDLADAWPSVAAAVPNAHLILVGAGGLELELGERLKDAPRVHFLGFRSDVPELMKALDVLAFPSHMEGFGLAAAEAMAAGTPVVGAHAGSLPEVFRDGVEGLLVPPRNPPELARALIRLASDADLRSRMGAAGRTRVEQRFRTERMLDEYEALLQRVVEEHASRSVRGDRRK